MKLSVRVKILALGNPLNSSPNLGLPELYVFVRSSQFIWLGLFIEKQFSLIYLPEPLPLPNEAIPLSIPLTYFT